MESSSYFYSSCFEDELFDFSHAGTLGEEDMENDSYDLADDNSLDSPGCSSGSDIENQGCFDSQSNSSYYFNSNGGGNFVSSNFNVGINGAICGSGGSPLHPAYHHDPNLVYTSGVGNEHENHQSLSGKDT